jgi:MFS family permease
MRGHRGTVRRLASASFASVIGTQAANIGLIALVFQRTHSGSWIAATMVANYAMRVVAAPWAGAISDRFDRRRVMISSNLAAATVFVGLAFARSPEMIVGLAALASAVQAPFPSASSALIGSLVPANDRGWANSMRAAAGSAGMLLGGLAGGALVAASGAAASFLINAASFLVSALVIASVRGVFRVDQIMVGHDRANLGLWAGVRVLRATPALMICAATMALTLLSVGMANVAEYPLVVGVGGTSAAYGVIVAAWAAGQFVGARIARRIETPVGEKRALGFGVLGTGLCVGSIGLFPSVVSMVVLFAISGVAWSAANVAATGVLQRWPPDAVRGRVFSTYTALQQTALGVSLCLGGTLLAGVNPRVVFILAGALGATSAFAATRMPPRADRPLSPDTTPNRQSASSREALRERRASSVPTFAS